MRISPTKRKRNLRRIGIRRRAGHGSPRVYRRWAALAAVTLLCACTAFAQSKKKGEDTSRSVRGTVMLEDGAPAMGAEVQLKNTKTLQIRSYVTQKDGTYFFHSLDSNTDYEVKAHYKDAWSPVKTVSSYDSKKDVTFDLKVNPK